MARRLDVARCGVCGHVVEVVHGGHGALWCCGRPVTIFSDKTVDREHEQYVPVIQATEDGVKVVVSGNGGESDGAHPIQWIEVIADDLVLRKYLKPGDPPEATFRVDSEGVRARAYCTQHGLCIER